jgi:2-(3-amino-3-carboxypropyl)histidine synthase
MEIVFIPTKYKHDLNEEFLGKVAEIPFKKLGIFTTVQFLNQLKQLEKFLKKDKKTVYSGGQILGCNPTGPLKIAKNVDAFVYLGSGIFHPLAVALETEKPIFIANPLTGIVNLLNKEDIERYKIQRKQTISRAKNAKIYGILVCTKKGQCNAKLAKEIKQKIEKKGKKAYIFIFETLIPESLMDFPQIEAWINTACPRIAIDDAERFDKPVVNWGDL